MYALGALSAELIFAQAILKEIGLSFLIHARADSSTARAAATKQGASRKMKHIHTRRGACSPWAEGGVVRREGNELARSFLGSRRLSSVGTGVFVEISMDEV